MAACAPKVEQRVQLTWNNYCWDACDFECKRYQKYCDHRKQKLSGPDIYHKTYSSVVAINTSTDIIDGPPVTTTASGFFVAKNVIQCRAVDVLFNNINENRNPPVLVPNATFGAPTSITVTVRSPRAGVPLLQYPARLMTVSPSLNVAYLQIDCLPSGYSSDFRMTRKHHLRWADNPRMTMPGDKAYIVSMIDGNSLITTGTVADALFSDPDLAYEAILVDATFPEAANGAPILNSRGKVIGMVDTLRGELVQGISAIVCEHVAKVAIAGPLDPCYGGALTATLEPNYYYNLFNYGYLGIQSINQTPANTLLQPNAFNGVRVTALDVNSPLNVIYQPGFAAQPIPIVDATNYLVITAVADDPVGTLEGDLPISSILMLNTPGMVIPVRVRTVLNYCEEIEVLVTLAARPASLEVPADFPIVPIV